MEIGEAKKILGEVYSFSADDLNNVIQELNLPGDAKILDVGTGMGSMAITIALHGFQVITGEPGDDETIYARQNWQENARKVKVESLIEFKAFNAGKMPFADGLFDAVFLLGALHHIPAEERPEVFRELVRIAKSGGIICFFEPRQKVIDMIRQKDPAHPDSAEPENYRPEGDLTLRQTTGENFDAFIYTLA
ncbi:MAG: class I SAM-dependent methyltransferase [Proteobacteria bacterium]|nr:class I SAM-dependent methyltransferase [Pseudomonadota bacterium]MBU1716146.1 class I SAM-dependent methyltransferase [Pseudomonadota bacterium]